MFSVSISTIVLIFTALPLFVVLILWIIFEKNKKVFRITYKDKELIVVCPYCAHVFLDSHQDDVVRCPSCDCFVDRKNGVDQP